MGKTQRKGGKAGKAPPQQVARMSDEEEQDESHSEGENEMGMTEEGDNEKEPQDASKNPRYVRACKRACVKLHLTTV
jgi:hypothetical protein